MGRCRLRCLELCFYRPFVYRPVMIHRTRGVVFVVLSCLALVSGCSKKSSDATDPQGVPDEVDVASTTGAEKDSNTAPPTPGMPPSWKIKSDTVVDPALVGQVAAKLGGELKALRNTVYDVGGKTVQINTMIAPDEAAAETLMAKLVTLKPAEFMLAKGLTIYEFMGKDIALGEMRSGRAHLAGGAAPATEADAQSAQAVSVALAWLDVVDKGQLDQAWEEAAPMLKASAGKKQFAQAVGAVRRPMGRVLLRKLQASTRTKSLPGVPDGDYVVVTFETSFDNKKSAVETVTPMLVVGHWMVSGYQVR